MIKNKYLYTLLNAHYQFNDIGYQGGVLLYHILASQ